MTPAFTGSPLLTRLADGARRNQRQRGPAALAAIAAALVVIAMTSVAHGWLDGVVASPAAPQNAEPVRMARASTLTLRPKSPTSQDAPPSKLARGGAVPDGLGRRSPEESLAEDAAATGMTVRLRPADPAAPNADRRRQPIQPQTAPAQMADAP